MGGCGVGWDLWGLCGGCGCGELVGEEDGEEDEDESVRTAGRGGSGV